MSETTADRLKRIREQAWPEADQNWAADIAWLSDALERALEELEEIQQVAPRLREMIAAYNAANSSESPKGSRCSHCGERRTACTCRMRKKVTDG